MAFFFFLLFAYDIIKVATAAKDLCKTNKRASGMQKPTKSEARAKILLQPPPVK